MRQQLNDNPMVQLAVVAVLVIGAGFFLLTMGGGGEEEGAEGESATVTATTTTPDGGTVSVTATAEAGEPGAVPTGPVSVPPLPPSAAEEAPPLPRAVTRAYEAGQTVVLLFVRKGGIDDRLVRDSVDQLRGTLPEAAVFVVPADKISRYAAIAQGVAVDRVPALVVVRPKNVGRGSGIPVASVGYGFQSSQSVVQAVVDAGYKGRTLDYHP